VSARALRQAFSLGAGACLLAAPAAAPAAPLVVPQLGGPVFVGPTDAHVTAIYTNPAAAGLMKGTHVFMSAAGRLDYTGIDRSTIDSADGEPAAGGDKSFAPESQTALTVTNFFGFVTDFSSNNVTLSLATFSPFAENQASGGPALAYHSAGGSFYSQAIALGISYRIQNWITFGVALNALFSTIHLEFARDTVLDTCAAPPCGVEDPAHAQRFDIHTGFDLAPRTFNAAFYLNVGVLLNLGDWVVGASVVTPPLPAFQKDADADVTPPGGAAAVTGGAQVSYSLPAVVNLGLRRPFFRDFDFVVNARYVFFSVQDKIDLRFFGRPLILAGVPEWVVRYRGLGDALAVEAGLEQAPATAVRRGARLRFETSAVPEGAQAADQVDAPKLQLAGGLELRVTPRVALVVGYALTLFLPGDATPSAFSPRAQIDCTASGYDIDTAACAAARAGRAIPTAAGSYRRIGNELTVGLAYDLW
jgi:long-subunit fatty acid transport protein